MKNIFDAVALLAYSQCFCLRGLELYKAMTHSERKTTFPPFEEYALLHQIIYEKLGFDYKGEDLLEDLKLLENKSFLEFTYVNSIEKNKIGDKIKEYHGIDAWIVYWFVLMFFNLAFLCQSATEVMLMIKREKSQSVKKNLMEQEKRMIKYFSESVWIFDIRIQLLEYYDEFLLKRLEEIDSFLKENKTHDLPLMIKLSELIEPMLDKVLPNYINGQNMNIGTTFIKELKSLKSGIKTWSDYEKLCIRILNFLLVPSFRKIYVQVKTIDGYERRDAIIPNNANTFFWNNIKHEFVSKNIVCEFKNLSKDGNKETLNQLRIYLSKPSIGKFGLLFLRHLDKAKSILKAQHDAYEQNGILVLIIDDKLLEKLILSKMYFNSCDDILESEKVRFEINY